MADVKVSGLPNDTSLDDNHYVILNDPTGPTTKRTTLGTIVAYLQAKAGWIVTAMIGDSQVTAAKLDKTTIPTRKISGILAASSGWNYLAIDQTAKVINIRVAAALTGGSAGDQLQLGLKNTNSGTPAADVAFTDAYITVTTSGTAGGDQRATNKVFFARTYNGGSGAIQAYIEASLFANNVAYSKGVTQSTTTMTQYDGIALLTNGIASMQYLGIYAAVAGNVTYEIEYIY